MGIAVVGLIALILGVWLGSDAAECRIYNQLSESGVAFIKRRLFKGGLHEGRVE
ncbi:hypothetical protein [Cupriavidus sp. RAF12]|uniref:hypothetical protein n=1 Tax=Cupriavidus sp. RAF12 TaxID=3233050 RepID=UPI003F90D718